MRILAGIISLICFGCVPGRYVEKKTNKVIKESYRNSDTIYLFSTNKLNVVWYHYEGYIHSFIVKPYAIKKYKPIYANDIPVKSDSLDKYFRVSSEKDIPCFYSALDGEFMNIYIHDKDTLYSGLDLECLFSRKYDKNSIPYKLQYDMSKIYRPEGYDFNTMYPDNAN